MHLWAIILLLLLFKGLNEIQQNKKLITMHKNKIVVLSNLCVCEEMQRVKCKNPNLVRRNFPGGCEVCCGLTSFEHTLRVLLCTHAGVYKLRM